MERLALLGATGSIGKSTLDVLSRHEDRFSLYGASAHSNVAKLVDIARRFNPEVVVISDESRYGELKDALRAAGLSTRAEAGAAALEALAGAPEVDSVMQAVVGAAGLRPTFRAVESGKRLLLANKESVVCGAELLMRRVKKCGATLLPVDSEHSAVFQCLQGVPASERARVKLWLTASGGPFRGRKDLSGITPAMAVAHPNWSMGRKISVDSASLMNKGLEVIEARHLFDVPPERIEVVVHPESVVHSMIELADGAVLAQLGSADMREPIGYAMGYPDRLPAGIRPLRLAEIGRLTFEDPDRETFPLLDAAYKALAMGAGSTVVLNAANEIAVEAFLNERIGFTDIFSTVLERLEKDRPAAPESVDDILAIDRETRAKTREALGLA